MAAMDGGDEGANYKQDKKFRTNLRSSDRDHKKIFEGSFMLDPPEPRKPYLSLGCTVHALPRPHRQTSRTDCPADRLKFFETLRLLLKLTSMSSKKKEKEQRGLESGAPAGQNNEVIWLELQAWHARRSVTDQDLYLYTERQAIPEIIARVLHFRVDYGGLAGADSRPEVDPKHLRRQRLAFQQVRGVMALLESVEALYPSLQTLQKDYEKYAARDFQARVQALCLWLNITQDLNQKLRVMGTVLGLGDLACIGWPVFEIPSPRCSHGDDDEEEVEDVVTDEVGASASMEELVPACSSCPTGIYRPFVDKALKQMGLRKLILRLHKLMDRSLQRSRTALLSHMPSQEVRGLKYADTCSDSAEDEGLKYFCSHW